MIEITKLQKIIDQGTALDISSLIVQPGEIVAVVGSPGSGKEVLFDLMVGKTSPSAGTIELAGIDPKDKPAFSRKVGVLFQEDGLYKRLSPIANLNLHCELYDLPHTRSYYVLEQIGLADQANARLDKLSPGLQRRLAFGRAILHKPEVLILFDPFVRCDEATVEQLCSLIQLLADQGTTILILADDSTHLYSLTDMIYALQQGRLIDVNQPGRQDMPTFKIPVRGEDKVILVDPASVLYAEAEGGRACLQTNNARLATQFTLGELEERLSRSGFFRTHRAYLVNLQHVKEVIPYTRNSFSLRLDDDAGTIIPLSKSAAGELRELLGY